MSDIINIYLHLDTPTFIAALARDDRSYSADIFFAASRILEGRNLKSPDEIAKLARLVRKIEDVRQKEAKDEEELGEIPDEFLGKICSRGPLAVQFVSFDRFCLYASLFRSMVTNVLFLLPRPPVLAFYFFLWIMNALTIEWRPYIYLFYFIFSIRAPVKIHCCTR